MDELLQSLNEYQEQLSMVNTTLETVNSINERESLLSLQTDLQQLINLTKESLETFVTKDVNTSSQSQNKDELDNEYALFKAEIEKDGAYGTCNKTNDSETSGDARENNDIEDELSSLLGMKCSVYHTHAWGGQTGLYNAMVSAIAPRESEVQFSDLQVRVLFTHPTHAEMLPCPFFLEGECKFSDDQCRYSHGALVQLSDLKDAIEPDFSSLRVGSRILMKLKPPINEDISVTKRSTEKYHLWHRAIVKSLDLEKHTCSVKIENGVHTGQKRKFGGDYVVKIEDIFPMDNAVNADNNVSDDSLSDTEYPENKTKCDDKSSDNRSLLIEQSLQNSNNTPIGEWERHTRGIGSKLMLAMGYVPGTGLGAASDGRVKPVEARVLPVGKSLDHCMSISQKNAGQDPLKVRVLFTHPTHAEMLPCPFFLEGECKFSDDQCRYSHGALVQLSDLKDAIEPDFSSLRVGSRILMKLKPPINEDISVTKRSTEKYHLWHRAIVKSLDLEKHTCSVKIENGVHTGQKRKFGGDYVVKIEDIFPMDNAVNADNNVSDDSLSDTEYPENKTKCDDKSSDNRSLLIEQSLQNSNNTPIGEWERHTRGIGSKLMLAMGYVPGTGLGAASDGRVKPVEARVLPVGKSLDHCMSISQKNAGQDPLKVEQRLKRLQKKEEERHKRAYEREKERERRNVFNFLNKTLGDQIEKQETESSLNVKQSSSKDLNIEQFKIAEDKKRIEREIIKLNSSLIKYPSGSGGHKSINLQIFEKNKELSGLIQKEKEINKEQAHRKDKQKMTVF